MYSYLKKMSVMVALAPMEPHLAFTKQTSLQIYACMHTLNSHPPNLILKCKSYSEYNVIEFQNLEICWSASCSP